MTIFSGTAWAKLEKDLDQLAEFHTQFLSILKSTSVTSAFEICHERWNDRDKIRFADGLNAYQMIAISQCCLCHKHFKINVNIYTKTASYP